MGAKLTSGLAQSGQGASTETNVPTNPLRLVELSVYTQDRRNSGPGARSEGAKLFVELAREEAMLPGTPRFMCKKGVPFLRTWPVEERQRDVKDKCTGAQKHHQSVQGAK